MRLSNCKQCNHFMQSMADCAVCTYDLELSYRAVYRGDVISCPMDSKSK